MRLPEPQRLQVVHRAYRRGRLELALTAALATASLMLFAWLMGNDGKTLSIGAVLMVVSSLSLYFGGSSGRAVLPAFTIGLIPFGALLIVQALSGHACHVGGCNAVCLPTCVVSGFAAGGLLAFVAVRTRAGLPFVAAGAAMTWLVGALGCPCIGMASLVGMAVGISIPTLAVAPKVARGRA